MRHVSYSFKAFDEPEALILAARQALKDVTYDTMVGRGLSGALVVPILARALGKKWAIVRKPGDGSHSTSRFEGEIGRRWIFVDDFIASGNTYFQTEEVVLAEGIANGEWPQLVGAYLYGTDMAAPHTAGVFVPAKGGAATLPGR